mgnify:CR=1 FL=1
MQSFLDNYVQVLHSNLILFVHDDNIAEPYALAYYPTIYLICPDRILIGGESKEAIEAFNEALTIKPDNAKAYNNIGVALREQGKLEETIAAYNKALAINPNYAEAHYHRSFALLNTNKFSEGFQEYEWRWKTKKFVKTF